MTNNLKSGERLDDLQLNGLQIIQDPERFCFGIDAVMLSDFARVKPGEKVLDLGTGTGILPILLSAKTRGEHLIGLEIQKESADMAQYPGWQAVLQYSKITSGYTESEVQGENGSMQIDRIADTRKITIHERTGRRDVILIPKEENNMVYEIREWLRLIENSQEDEKSKIYEEASGNEMQFLDLAREKMGIRFPADVS